MLLLVLVGVSIITFVLVRAAPGDPAVNLAGQHANEKILESIREKYHLNDPIYVQYYIWVRMAVRGDLGQSIVSHDSVISEITHRLPMTLELSILAMSIAIVFGVLAGIVSAVRQYSKIDYSVMFGALFGVSMPVFWLGIMMIYIFSIKLGITPVQGRLTTASNLSASRACTSLTASSPSTGRHL
jgi:peptide/nickel transport system permease protein